MANKAVYDIGKADNKWMGVFQQSYSTQYVIQPLVSDSDYMYMYGFSENLHDNQESYLI